MKANKSPRRNFIKKTAAISAGIMMLPHQFLNRKENSLSSIIVNRGNTLMDGSIPKAKLSFLNRPEPVISGIIAGQTPEELIASARNSESEGANGITVDLFDLMPEFRNTETFKRIIDSVNLPFMFYFYRGDKWQKSTDDDRQLVLLDAAEAGASMIDVMGDLYDPSPREITFNPIAVEKQKRLIEEIHGRGADVVMSSHTGCYLSVEEVVSHMTEMESRGPDVVKIVTTINTKEELAEALLTTITLNRELSIPFIHLCTGKYGRPHRYMCPMLGTSIMFAVPYYTDRYPGLSQPTIKSIKAVLGNIRWNINNL